MKKGDVIFGILMLITLVFLIISLVPKNYPTHCSDKVFNLNEERIDCGGECKPCYEKYPSLGTNKTIPVASIIIIFIAFLSIIIVYRNINKVESKIHKLVKEAEDLVDKDINQATKVYHEIKKHYSALPKQKQKKVYQKTIKIYQKIAKENVRRTR
jgi:hypothetical protein